MPLSKYLLYCHAIVSVHLLVGCRRLEQIELSEHKNSVSEHQNFKIFSDGMHPDPLAARTLGTHVIRRLFKKYIPIVRTQKVVQSEY